MKKIYLMRHSVAQKIDLPTELIPISDEGIILAKAKIENFINISKCFSSPYKRAIETAELITNQVTIVNNLHERIIGDAKDKDFWIKQYENHDYRNQNGESLNEVRERMKAAIELILEDMCDEEEVLLVSHATAICAYLMNFCEVEVMDTQTKARKIAYKNEIIMNGVFPNTAYFEIEYENNEVNSISFYE